MSSNLPANWSGGRLENLPGDPQPLNSDWYDEAAWAADDWIDVARDWAPLLALGAGDPREEWGTLDLGVRASPRAGDREPEEIVAKVAQVSINFGGGLLLVGHEGWLSRSRWGTVTEDEVLGLLPGDEVRVGVSHSQAGKAFITSLEVLQRRPARPGWG